MATPRAAASTWSSDAGDASTGRSAPAHAGKPPSRTDTLHHKKISIMVFGWSDLAVLHSEQARILSPDEHALQRASFAACFSTHRSHKNCHEHCADHAGSLLPAATSCCLLQKYTYTRTTACASWEQVGAHFSWPKARKVHQTRGALNTPALSYRTTCSGTTKHDSWLHPQHIQSQSPSVLLIDSISLFCFRDGSVRSHTRQCLVPWCLWD